MNGFSEAGSEQIARHAVVLAYVCADGNDGGALVEIVGTLDISRCRFTVNDRHMVVHEDEIEFCRNALAKGLHGQSIAY